MDCHEDLRASAKCRAVFDALVDGLKGPYACLAKKSAICTGLPIQAYHDFFARHPFLLRIQPGLQALQSVASDLCRWRGPKLSFCECPAKELVQERGSKPSMTTAEIRRMVGHRGLEPFKRQLDKRLRHRVLTMQSWFRATRLVAALLAL